MSGVAPVRGAALLRRRIGGVVFLGVIAGLAWLSVLLYQKAFAPVVSVTLRADRIGNQLSPPADVKVRGVLVGEVRSVATSGDGATVEIALNRDSAELVPADVRAQLLPKTLFGEKYVSLVVPEGSSGRPIREGDVIPQDRSQTAMETAQALDDLLPLLQALEPEQLSTTLNALSSALRGRGERIGRNLERVDAYLRQFNPELPELRENLRGLADFADTVDEAAPDLLSVLDDFSYSSRALVDQREELDRFLSTTASFAAETDGFLRENERRLVRLAHDSLPPLQTYARYSPQFPCMAAGLVRFHPRVADTFGGLQPALHITLELIEDQDAYVPGDEPQYRDDRGPECYGLPDDVTVPAEDINYQDGYRDEGPPDSTQGRAPADAASDPARALSSPAGQRAVLGALAAPVLGTSVDQVPDVVALLLGPVARGTEAGVR